jgi:hypothetical protein
MRLIATVIAAPVLVMLGLACNTVSPDECWVNTSGGFGGSGTIPIGAGVGATSGDFASPPRGPLDYSDEANPCRVQESPCVEKCLADYETVAIGCGKIEDEAQRNVCGDGAFATYKSCRGSCAQQYNDCREHCRDLCYNAWEKCRDDCPKGDRNCLSECTNTLATCFRECDRKCK